MPFPFVRRSEGVWGKLNPLREGDAGCVLEWVAMREDRSAQGTQSAESLRPGAPVSGSWGLLQGRGSVEGGRKRDQRPEEAWS